MQERLVSAEDYMYQIGDEIDRTGCKCRKCPKGYAGTYRERTLQDAWDEILRCNVCGHSIRRFLAVNVPRMP